MTKYILAGGNDRGFANYWEKLRLEVKKSVNGPATFLSCQFSQPESEWDERFTSWKGWLENHFSKEYNYVLASKSVFRKQLADADLLYLHGGDTKSLKQRLESLNITKRDFKNKIVIGSSAGANYLSSKYWSSTNRAPGRGSGIVDVNIMVHYGSTDHDGIQRDQKMWEDEEKKFMDFAHSGNILRLKEGEFEVFEV